MSVSKVYFGITISSSSKLSMKGKALRQSVLTIDIFILVITISMFWHATFAASK
jgi:hypothetical protein